MSIVLAHQAATALLLKPVPIQCIEYPRELPKSDVAAPIYVCLNKALWVADNLLGPRSEEVKSRFQQLLRLRGCAAVETDMAYHVSPKRPSVDGGPAAVQATARTSMGRRPTENAAAIAAGEALWGLRLLGCFFGGLGIVSQQQPVLLAPRFDARMQSFYMLWKCWGKRRVGFFQHRW